MSRRVLRWFGDKRTETVLNMVLEHLEMTQGAVRELFNMVCSACEQSEDTNIFYNKISDFEMKADQLRRKMIDELTKRDIFPSEREDLMELVRAVDWVADWSREAGRILVIIPFDKSPDEMKMAARNMCKANLDCVMVLASCIRALHEDKFKAIELANEVEMLEEEVDERYSVARKYLATLKYPNFSLGALILLNEFLDAVETVADWCENTVDIVRAIVVRL